MKITHCDKCKEKIEGAYCSCTLYQTDVVCAGEYPEYDLCLKCGRELEKQLKNV